MSTRSPVVRSYRRRWPSYRARGRLLGVDGRAKMSKSAGNAIALSASPGAITAAVRAMFTDPDHLRVGDPGKVEGNVVFSYLDAFDDDHHAVEELKARYRRGGLGDAAVKRRLEDILQALIAPIRTRRAELAGDRDHVADVIRRGTSKAREITERTKRDVMAGLGVFQL
ncbi:tryptophanyl-tRNA synthetase [Bradyrhizobium sp. USDA 4508]